MHSSTSLFFFFYREASLTRSKNGVFVVVVNVDLENFFLYFFFFCNFGLFEYSRYVAWKIVFTFEHFWHSREL